jgi:7-cyano-7-deazaguanine synthase in queuosine biosynthesis
MDSWINLCWVRSHGRDRFHPVKALYVDFGHRYAAKEKDAVTALLSYFRKEEVELITKEMHWLGEEFEDNTAFIPLRNLYLIQIASHYADNIVFGMLHGEQPPDKNPRFVARMERELNEQYAKSVYQEGRHVNIITPFRNKTKSEMVAWYLSHTWPDDWRVMPEPEGVKLARKHLFQTVGCFESGGGRCGICSSCFNRWVALTNNGLIESYRHGMPHTYGLMKLFGTGGEMKARKKLEYIWRRRRWLVECWRAYRTYFSGEKLRGEDEAGAEPPKSRLQTGRKDTVASKSVWNASDYSTPERGS